MGGLELRTIGKDGVGAPFGPKNFQFMQQDQLAKRIDVEMVFSAYTQSGEYLKSYKIENNLFRETQRIDHGLVWSKGIYPKDRDLLPALLYELLLDKYEFYQYLKSKGINTPWSTMINAGATYKADCDLVVKPRFGSQGAGVFRLRKGQVHRAREEFVVQKMIHSIQLNGQPIDIRVLVQQRGGDDYFVHAISIRQSNDGLISNLAGGGTALPFEALEKVYKGNWLDLRSKIEEQSLFLAQLLVRDFGSFPEMGIDFMLGSDRDLYLLEANANVGKWVFVSLSDLYPTGSFLNRKYWGQRLDALANPLYYVKNQYFSREHISQ